MRDPMSWALTAFRAFGITVRVHLFFFLITIPLCFRQIYILPHVWWVDIVLVSVVALFAVVAVALAAGGIYGVVSHSVERRSREIAVRLAVGARPDEVVRLILRQHLSWALGGIGLGAIGASVLVRLLTTQLFGVVSLHIPTFLEAAIALLCVGFGANLAPALRATRIAPGSALRCE